MALKQLLLLMALTFFVDAFKWRNCDKSSPVQVKQIMLSPDPIKLSKGKSITFGGAFQVTGKPGTQYKLHLKIEKSMWFWVTVPCISNVGSCTYDLACDKMVDLLEEKQCPLSPKTYVVEERTEVLPDVPIPSFLSSGHYKIRGDLRDTANNARISCVEAELHISS